MTDNPAAQTLHDQLATFVGEARWFGGKGREFEVTDVRRLGVLGASDGGPVVLLSLVELGFSGGDRELYQLPLALYSERQERLGHALVAVDDVEGFGPSYVYDAVHDREAMDHLLRAFAEATPHDAGGVETGAGAPSSTTGRSDGLTFHRLPGHDLDTTAHSTLFSGEQSNSTVMFGEDSLLKVFRKVTPGVNPDIGVHEVLTRAGSDKVAALYGWLEAREKSGDGEPLQLAMLQQFLRTASDGWDLALTSVRNLFAEADLHADEVGGDFAAEAARLGEALSEVHALLAEHFPTADRSTDEMGALGATMAQRLDAAVAIVPELAAYAPALRGVFTAVGRLDGVTVQQIHGDLHLGQTLRTVKGWKIVDFEGEPAKPLAERVRPDSPWRDVAGMLRSFDYAPRVSAHQWGDTDGGAAQREYRAAEWSARNCTAFLEAYAGRALTGAEQVLLDAYVVDKAVYEVVYEARNRPKWVPIPMSAIQRLVERSPE
ncbi:maltokinase N-terminal cap-like domain-containing protein [Nocardioides bigeumensis]|uniref:Maltokinase n=1 Tax=Nocardioides bigeumensis TaxID=433657 RepID=A0ABN2Y8M1_9ACTN